MGRSPPDDIATLGKEAAVPESARRRPIWFVLEGAADRPQSTWSLCYVTGNVEVEL